LRSDTVLKAGEGSYYISSSGLNRWGDYSATCVDPVNDLTLWTIQEYAHAGNLWGTWWGRVDPAPPSPSPDPKFSPVGWWTTTLSGAEQGTAIFNFNDDFSVTGHGVTLAHRGLFTITGSWQFHEKHRVVGTYEARLDGQLLYSGEFVLKARAGRKLTGRVTAAALPRRIKLSGKPLAPMADLRGHWAARVKTRGQSTNETYQLVASAVFANVFELTGQTPAGATTGGMMGGQRGKLNGWMTGAVERSVAGRTVATDGMVLKGRDAAGAAVRIRAQR
jgi:hypothetical protein